MRPQETIMREAGFITAVEAKEVIGYAHVGNVHNLLKGEHPMLEGARVGGRWYVSVASLLQRYKDVAIIVERIKALNVKPVKPNGAGRAKG